MSFRSLFISSVGLFVAASFLTVPFASAQNAVPFRLDGTATWDNLANAFNPNVGAIFNDGAGQATHLGRFSANGSLFATDAPDANGDFPVIGWVTLKAANGDELDAFFWGILNLSGSGFADFTFLGGNGRFDGATGGGTLSAFLDLSAGLENVPMDVQWDGMIDY